MTMCGYLNMRTSVVVTSTPPLRCGLWVVDDGKGKVLYSGYVSAMLEQRCGITAHLVKTGLF